MKKSELNKNYSRRFWENLLGRPIGKPYGGIVEEYSNYLGKFLPKNTRITIEEVIGAC